MGENIRKAFAGILAGLALLFAPVMATEADAATKGKSVCDTGSRGQREYDRLCLKTGTFKDGAMLWLSVPAGKKGHEKRDAYNRRSQCKFAKEFGGITAVARDLSFDVAYDNFRNHATVLNWSAAVAKMDCRAMGYRV
ncbi:hypothetical protein [Streptomyces cucumeris]|uniref:hypothetical protein n=1 Tax=Streptomyces cucumeris TaxID=2962890 RepID=UPI0020C9304E|nr:hypothetical protein [Streptomyces sp. NEAU-Y11]MCP9209543.1 hypothetical protein [Streptomyces sp. NEAU-Y11]